MRHLQMGAGANPLENSVTIISTFSEMCWGGISGPQIHVEIVVKNISIDFLPSNYDAIMGGFGYSSPF